MKAVSGTGLTSMSDSLIACQPRMLEPSKPKPRSKVSSSSSRAGTEKCCHRPGKVHEPQVHDLDVFLGDEIENFFRFLRVCHRGLL